MCEGSLVGPVFKFRMGDLRGRTRVCEGSLVGPVFKFRMGGSQRDDKSV